MEEQMRIEDSFNTILSDAVDEVLSTLGQSAKTLVYVHMVTNLKIGKQDIPNRLNDFMAELEKLFGGSAKKLERQLIKTLEARTKFAYPQSVEDVALEDYVHFVRQKLAASLALFV